MNNFRKQSSIKKRSATQIPTIIKILQDQRSFLDEIAILIGFAQGVGTASFAANENYLIKRDSCGSKDIVDDPTQATLLLKQKEKRSGDGLRPNKNDNSMEFEFLFCCFL